MGNDQAVLFGVEIDSLSQDEILERIAKSVSTQERLLIAHVNIHGLNLAYNLPWLKDFYNHAGLVYCDGFGIKIGARLAGFNIPERFTLADWISDLALLAADRSFKLFFFGNPPGVADDAARRLVALYPDLLVCGVQHGYIDLSPESSDNQTLIARINSQKPDIILVGLGMPLQEKWLLENWSNLGAPVAITCGALFEYISGDLPRGPRWMTDHYLEWLARLIISPRRYIKRYLLDIPLFSLRLARQRLYGK